MRVLSWRWCFSRRCNRRRGLFSWEQGMAYSWRVVGSVKTASSEVRRGSSESSVVPTDIISGELIWREDSLPMSWVKVAEKTSFRTLR